ncbi:TPA: hypothetical protein DIC40_04645 [Patescibacteria group bacterium]|nr:hypothetical protein [Candidatus Gracilibacteria bacterium]
MIVKNITKEEQPIHKKKNTIIDNLEKRRAKIIPYKTIPINRKELYHVGEKSINDETFRRYLLDIID